MSELIWGFLTSIYFPIFSFNFKLILQLLPKDNIVTQSFAAFYLSTVMRQSAIGTTSLIRDIDSRRESLGGLSKLHYKKRQRKER